MAKPASRPLIIYHGGGSRKDNAGGCTDGKAAAFAAWLKHGDQADYLPVAHTDAPPDVTGRDVVMLDFAFPRKETEAMIAAAKSFILLDHHIDAYQELDGLPGCHFDLKKSGATMAWAHFHPNKPTPRLFTHVEDGDLQLNHLKETADIRAYLYKLPADFTRWRAAMDQLEHPDERQELIDKGHQLRKESGIVTAAFVRSAKPVRIGLLFGLMAQAPKEYSSDVAEALAREAATLGMPGAIGLTWRVSDTAPDSMVVGSVRTGAPEVDCRFVARQLGGGGGNAKSTGLRVATEKWFPVMGKILQAANDAPDAKVIPIRNSHRLKRLE